LHLYGGVTAVMVLNSVLHAITDFGDSALLLPVSLVLCAYLWLGGWTRQALALAVSLAACIGLTVVLKIGFHACGYEVSRLAIQSPSGHTAFSTTVYGCGALLLATGRSRANRIAIAFAAVALIAAISASRILLHAHSAAEVVAGLAVGLGCVAFFRLRIAAAPEIAPRWRLLLAAFAMLVVLTHGHHLDAEELIRHIAAKLSNAADVCQVASRT
jgi:membrane-associated phospholipid phosphatase